MRSKRLKRFLLLVCGILVLGCVLTLVPEREPKYQQHTLGEWLDPNAGFTHSNDDLRNAVRAIGTNHLSMLVRRIAYDHKRSMRTKFVLSFPSGIAPKPLLRKLESQIASEITLANDSAEAFRFLGPLGVPAIPQLTLLLNSGDSGPAWRALEALAYIGEPAIPTLVAVAQDAKHPLHRLTLGKLAGFPNSTAAVAALTSAQDPPSPH